MVGKIKIESDDCIGVSVIIPAKNESEHIELCIDSILSQSLDLPLEVIVVNNDSFDNTAVLAKSKGVMVVDTAVKTAAAVRNLGASISKYPILAFIDGDCEAPVYWLSRAVSSLNSDPKLGALGGPCKSPHNANWIVRHWAPPFQYSGKLRGGVLPGANLVVLKKIFNDLGGFDEALVTAEDDDFCLRVHGHGYDIECDFSNSVIHHGYPDSLSEIFLKSVWHGTTQVRAHGFFGDKLVILSWLWGATIFWLLPSLLVLPSFVFLIEVLVILIFPCLLAFSRLKKCSFSLMLKMFIPTSYISGFVLMGRFIGLVSECFKTYNGKVSSILLNSAAK